MAGLVLRPEDVRVLVLLLIVGLLLILVSLLLSADRAANRPTGAAPQRCPNWSCRQPNRHAARFCARCGAALGKSRD